MAVITVAIPDAIASFIAVASDATSVVVNTESTAGTLVAESPSLPSSDFDLHLDGAIFVLPLYYWVLLTVELRLKEAIDFTK